MKRLFAILFIAAVSLLFSCGDTPVPLKEMSKAKEAITRAQSVNAEKYASDDMNEANSLILDSHTKVADENYDDAADLAKKAEEKANDAYEKSAPIASKDAIGAAEQALEDAQSVKAQKLAPAEYADADNKLSSAKYLYDAGKFPESYTKANEAKDAAFVAKSVALEKKPSKGKSNYSASSSSSSSKKGKLVKGKDYFLYVVKAKKSPPKDTLANLARKFYGDMYKWVAIYNANKDVIKDPNVLSPGMELRIPKKKVVNKFMYGNYKASGDVNSSDDPDEIEENLNWKKK